MKTIKLDQEKLLGFKILPQTPKVGGKPGEVKTSVAIKGKIGGKVGDKPSAKLGSKIGAKVGSKGS